MGAIKQEAIRIFFTLFDILFFPYKIIKSGWIEKQASGLFFLEQLLALVNRQFLELFVILSVSSTLLGFLVVSQVQEQLGQFISYDLQCRTIIYLLMWEIGPALVMLVQRARIGTTLTMELAMMRLNQSQSALSAMGINLEYYYLLPRFVAFIVVGILLCAWTNFCSLIVGQSLVGLVWRKFGMLSLNDLVHALNLKDGVILLVKSFGFSYLTLSSQCHFPMQTENISAGITRLNARAASYNFAMCLVFNFAVTILGGLI